MLKVIGSLLLVSMFSATALAKSNVHQIEASFNFDQREFDFDDSPADFDIDVMNLQVKYRNQFKPNIFLVGDLEFMNGDSTFETIILTGAGEYNIMQDSPNMEAGIGFGVRLFTGDMSGFGVRPYGFLRSFLSDDIFVSANLNYDWAILDWNDADGDLAGITLTAGFGYAF